jgi:hypothetical protein
MLAPLNTNSEVSLSPLRRRRKSRRLLHAAAVAAALAVAAGVGSNAVAAKATVGGFGYPVKPFHREHPVRGYFGDPRTVFITPPTLTGLMTGEGSFSFHQGVDISAPDGTAVYPVASGVVSEVTPAWVRVNSGDGRAFEYWHIRPAVHTGDHVEVDTTVLGHILREAEHVHLTEVQDGVVVNPLARGRLTPFTDTTAPQVESISFRSGEDGTSELPAFLRGRVEIVADAFDRPTLAAPGIWKGLPTTPALVAWRIQRPNGVVVVPERVAADFRGTVPKNSAFWTVYARGTYQNMCVFGKHYSYMQNGQYLFKLTPTPFDTHVLNDGIYDLVVTATDMRGNSRSLAERITVHNEAGWVGP